ncbi:type II toxin-antitoxin system Phd/YefM family antitoxin [Candidatus Ferrigenium straubiae]|jgi:antitoxin YefM|uniref:type II toxin-antitoxin system Phd/YefM family antitoxin n=1 Tax=Candidatus Ferrigenium straubiae TaxID=2919506 RepID=UPI003F4ADD72
MDATTYTNARNSIAKTMDKVNENHEPITITRQNGAPAVLMSLEGFNAWEETAYLLRNPANAKRLSSAIASIDSGKVKEWSLLK